MHEQKTASEVRPENSEEPGTVVSRRVFIGGLAGVGALAYAAATPLRAGAAAKFTFPFQNPHRPLEQRIDDLLGRLTLPEKVSLLHQYQLPIDSLGMPLFKIGTESLHGLAWSNDFNDNGNQVFAVATVFPQGHGLGCTWDPDLMQSIGGVIGREARGFHSENPIVWGLNLFTPVVNLLRDPRWGRNEEGYSEDAMLTGVASTAIASGVQGPDPDHLLAAPTLKHFMAYNNEVNRTESSSVLQPRVLREYDEMAFKPALAADAATGVMTSYNLVNGRPATVSNYINDDIRTWTDRDLMVVSDAGAPENLVTQQDYFANTTEADGAAVLAGLDSFNQDSQVPTNTINALTAALAQGIITEDDVDVTARRLLSIRFRLGDFDPPGFGPYASITMADVNTPASQRLARQAVREQFVLLKNDGDMLPLRRSQKIALIGPLSDQVFQDFYGGDMPYRVDPLTGVQEALAGTSGTVTGALGVDQIALQAPNGMFVTAPASASGGQLAATAATAGDNETLAIFDWGNSVTSIRANANNLYLTRGAGNAVINDQIEPNGFSTPSQVWTFVEQPDGTVIIQQGTSTRQFVVADATTGLLTANGTTTTATHFTVQTLVNGVDEAVSAAADADVAVVIVGNDPMVGAKETTDRTDLNLVPSQEALVLAVATANPKTVLVIESSYPYAINQEQASARIPSILASSHGGQETGHGFADVLFGDYAPAGRLSQTWYGSADDLPSILDYDIIHDDRTYMYFQGTPLYPFGHGLTYTTFRYSNLKLAPARRMNRNGQTRISVDVTNAGPVASDEVVQLYTHQRTSRVKQPIVKLRDFQRLHFGPGQTRTVVFDLKASDLAFWDVTRNQWVVEAASHDIMVGRSSADIQQRAVLDVSGEVIPPRDLTRLTQARDFDDYSEATIVDASHTEGDAMHQTAIGGWIQFADTDFGDGISTITASVANDQATAGSLSVMLDDPVTGTLVGNVPVPSTGDRYTFAVQSAAVSGATGVHDVYFVFTGNAYLATFQFS